MKKRYTKNNYFKVASALSLWMEDYNLSMTDACAQTKADLLLFVWLLRNGQGLIDWENELCWGEDSINADYIAIQLACEKAGL